MNLSTFDTPGPVPHCAYWMKNKWAWSEAGYGFMEKFSYSLFFLVDDNNYNTLMNTISLQIFGVKYVYFKQLSKKCHTKNKVSVNLFVFMWL